MYKRTVLSIVIPALNEERAIEKTLRNLVKVKRPKTEIIVSDGGSTDNTVKLASRYATLVVRHKGRARQTIAVGRNHGAWKANGEFIVFLDADVTIPEPRQFFRKALNVFEKDGKIVALTCNLKVLKQHESFGDKLVFGFLNLFHRFMNNVVHSGRASGEFQMYRTAFFREIGGFSESMAAGEDYEIFFRASRHGKTRFEPSLTVFHTGRRAHKIGWPRLLFTWFLNTISWTFLKKSASKEWKVVR